MALEAFTVGTAFVFGMAGFFSPCSAGLLPAYIATIAGTRDGRVRVGRGVLLSIAAGLGPLIVFAAAGAVLAFVPMAALRSRLPPVSLTLAVVVVALGVFYAFGGHLHHFDAARITGAFQRMPYLFGVAYALISLGCTLPLFAAAVAAALASGGGLTAGLAVGAFGLGMGLLVALAALLSLWSREAVAERLQKAVPVVQRVAGVVMVVAGGYLVWFWAPKVF